MKKSTSKLFVSHSYNDSEVGEVVASLEKKYYNLKTGEVILDGSYKTGGYISERSVKSDHYVFLEGCSIEKTPSHNRKNIVYQIEFSTGKLTIIE